MHYPTDVIGGRILATYLIAETLAGNPLYPSTNLTPASLAALGQTMQTYLGGGGSSPYPVQCARQRCRLVLPAARSPALLPMHSSQ